ncbi:MAG: hypothetical protein ACK4S4_15515 [Pyrinomonadaceae bacterium]
MTTLKVTASAKFPQMRPAHNAFITKTGEGTNLDRAVRDAVHNLLTDDRLKGKRASNILPVTIVVQQFRPDEDDQS